MGKVSSVNVLMSTFNGSRFVEQQLDSILAQTHKHITVHVRDDGSTDDTLNILCQYASRHKIINVQAHSNVGAAWSFMELLKEAEPTCSYFAFSDQDDYWLPDKVQNAVAKLDAVGKDIPALYCGRLEYADTDLRSIGLSRVPKRLAFENALVENVATGCTVVLNQAARELIIGHLPGRIIMHDWWCYIIVSAFGVTIYDEVPQIKYRQHSGNLVGGTPNVIGQAVRRLRRFVRSQSDQLSVVDQAREFYDAFHGMLDVERDRVVRGLMESKTSVSSRCTYAFKKEVWRQSCVDDLILRGLLAVGRY